MDYEKVDLLTEIDSLRRGWQACEARLAAVEAERDSLIDQIADAGKKVQALTAERDAARAGEARAVEALEAEQRAAHWRNLARITDKHEDYLEATRLSEIAQQLRHGIVLVENSPALAWLAQREREAAAKELLGLKDSICGGTYRPHVAWRCISTRAALLRAGKGGE